MSSKRDLPSLHRRVTRAIWRAEQAETLGRPTAKALWKRAAKAEFFLAAVLPGIDPEGRVARRGAIGALLKSGEYTMARMLLRRLMVEADSPDDLKAELLKMVEAGPGTGLKRYW